MEEDAMKRNMTLQKFMALVLSLVLTLSLTTAAFATGNVGGDTPTCDRSLGCQDGSHVEDCPGHPDNAAAIKAVHDMIDALPMEVTADNLDDVEAQLSQIKAKLDAMNETCRGQVNATKYAAAEKALIALSAPDSEEPPADEKENPPADPTPVDPTPADPTREEAAAALVSNLPAEVTKDNAADVESTLAAIAEYEDILTEDQKAVRDDCQAKVAAVRAQMDLDRVNALMDKLPEVGTVTAEALTEEQAEGYKALLKEIDNALLTLTDEQKAAVDRSRYESLANALSSYYEILNMADDVAEVNGTPYSTLQEAIANAGDNAIVNLLKDVTTGSITLSKPVTLNLNNCKLNGPDDNYAFNIAADINVTVTGGTIEGYRGFNCTAGTLTLTGVTLTTTERAIANYDSSTVNIGSGTVVSSDYAPIVVWGDSANSKKPTLNVSGTVISKGSYAAIQGNGDDNSGTTVNVKDGADIQAKTVGIYNPQPNSVLNVTGGKITGATGIEMRAGKLNVSGGTITGTGTKIVVQPSGSGSTTSGAGIAVAQHTTKQPITVTISGGIISGASAVYESDPQGNGQPAIDKVSVNISGGKFSSSAEGGETVHSGSEKLTVSGGTFNQPVPEKYWAENFHCSSKPGDDGNFTVHAHTIELKGNVEATCGKDGYTGDKVCTTCDEVVEKGKAIPATGAHTYDENTWDYDASSHWHGCKICGSGKKDTAKHSFVWKTGSRDTSSAKVQMCSVCNYVSDTDWSKLELTLGSNRTTVRSGKTITYTLTVTNKTGMDMDEVVVSGKLGKNLTFSKAAGDGEYDSKNNLWIISDLKAGKSASLTLRVNVKSGVKSGTKLEYTAAVTDAEAYNGETYPDKSLSSATSTVKVSSGVFSTNPKTGDPNNVGLWIAVMAVSLAALIAVVVILIKSRKK